ncbi:DUF5658 family protein [Cytobacillus sp. FJAT-54145]|uniref:DUF5658 family protein n=1 Tax=Cytobacillus spartinae TaxID=3299023 RepID=A0ABW6KGX5_9BACI
MVIILFFYLGILNIIDAILTFFGLSIQVIEEANPIMNAVYTLDPSLFLIVKISLSLLLFSLIFLKPIQQSQLIKNLSFLSSILYTFICLLHITWLTQL